MAEPKAPLPIDFQHVSYTYPEQDSAALKDVSLEIETGEYVVIMGPNGAGKTTLCMLMNGVIPNVLGGKIRGKTEVMGFNTRRHHVYEMGQYVGIVLQDPEAQLFTSDVRSEIAFAAENLGVPREEMIRRIDWILDVVRLEKFVDRPPAQLSGGQKQRLAVASALVMQPKVIVLDEPTSQLDPIGSQEVFSVLRDLNQELGMTVVLATHKSEYSARYADRVLVLNEGEIITEGSPVKVFSQVKLLDSVNVQIPAVTRVENEISPILQAKDLSIRLEDSTEVLSELLDSKGRKKGELAESEREIQPLTKSDQPYIELENVSFKYPSMDREALSGISFRVGKGEFVGIVGQNGAGKTTLVKNIIGLLKPTSGKVMVDGINTGDAVVEEIAQKVGLVLQNPDSQLFAMSVAEEIAFGPANMGFPENQIKKQVEEALTASGLQEFKDIYPFNLSFGDRRKLSVAAVVSVNPDILIFDEPTTGQDYKGRRELADIAKNLNNNGRTVIMITHDMDLIAEYTERLIVMGDGTILLDGPTGEVFQEVELLAKTFIEPPQVIQLALNLAKFGVPREVLVVEDLCVYLKNEVGL